MLLDYLRATDPAAAKLGYPLPSAAELQTILKALEDKRPPQDHIAINEMNSEEGRAILGGITAHQYWASAGVPTKIFPPKLFAKYGIPDHARTIAEGFSPMMRDNAISGRIHPLHVAQVSI